MSRIKTYEDLEAEEKRLEALLYSHKENIKDNFEEVKKGLNPFRQAAETARRLFTRDKSNPMMKFGLDLGVDVLVRKFLLAKAGWFTKIIVPFFIKNYSTHFVTQYKKSKFLQKIWSYFKQEAKDVKDVVKEGMHDIKEEVKDTTEEVKQSVTNKT
jgi:hypothetical protein